MEYIRKFYGVPAKRGAKVRIHVSYDKDVTFNGTIVASKGEYIKVKIPGGKKSLAYHPVDHIEYL